MLFEFRPWLLVVVAALPACSAFDPYRRAGTWRPSGVNEQNALVMAVQPHERVAGTGSTSSLGQGSSVAIERFRADRVRPLPDSSVARLITVPGGGQGNN
jgi:hypothetical protein